MVPQSSTFDYPIFAHANVVGAKSKSAEIILQFESKRRHTVSNILSQQSAEARAQATCSSAAQPVQERRATEKTTRFDSEEFQRSLSRKEGRQQKKKENTATPRAIHRKYCRGEKNSRILSGTVAHAESQDRKKDTHTRFIYKETENLSRKR